MIKILIIEDNPEKCRLIREYLRAVCNISDDDVDVANCINIGREALMRNMYDVLLLDLVLPINEFDDPSPEHGTAFLDEIHYNPNINIPVHIIGLTEFDNIFKDFYENFEDKLWGLINFKISDSDWKNKLSSKVFYLQKFKSKYEDFIEKKYNYDIAIITALNSEFEQLLKVADWQRLNVADDQILYYETIINTKKNNNVRIICSCINQMGMQASASVSAKLIAKFSPKHVFINGICAGLSSANLQIGDIIVATQSWDYESGKVNENSNGELVFTPEMKVIPTDQGMISHLTSFSNERKKLFELHDSFKGNRPRQQPVVRFGPVGSGPYVLSSSQYLNKLTQTERKLIAIDMEGFGIYRSAQYFKAVIPIFIKGVSDLGDKNKSDDFHEYAAFASSKFTIDFVESYF